MIDPAYLRLILDYDGATGEFRWKRRSNQTTAWNAKMAGRIAGTRCANGHIGIRIDGRRHLAHRLAWLLIKGDIPGDYQIDHIDRNGSNNRLENLRLATQSQNNANSIHSSASGVKGASWRADRAKWQARITIRGKSVNLGYYATAGEAHMRYLERAKAEYGRFARGA